MSRLTPIAVAISLASLRASAADGQAITNWFDHGATDAAAAKTVLTESSFPLFGGKDVRSAVWSVFDPIPLAVDKPVTFSCKVKIPEDLPLRSTAQIRIGIYGVVSGTSPTATKQRDLRGFVVTGGAQDRQWRLELAEHASDVGPLIFTAGMTNRATTQVEATGGRGTDARVVITLTKKSADLISCSGFWADVPFSFEVAPLAGDYTHLRAVCVMRGAVSGTGDLTFSNVRIRSD